ncbi:MAG: DNA polymerase III subunit beta [Elusimicrobia bacterium]|nr:DNA polymerase III subunit beta [Elusimicrobiota bacterium]
MKIHCTKEDLSKGVQTIQSALSNRTTLPILLNFLMETEQAKLKVVSTNLEMGVKHYIHAQVESDGSVTIPAKKFADILHTLPEGQEVELSVDTSGKVHLKCGKARFWIIGTPKSEYPVLPEFNKTGAFQLSSKLLTEMVRKTIYAASTDETRYVLNGVLWVASKGTLEMVATDGRRLACVRRQGIPEGKEFKVIVPIKILQEFLRLQSLAEVDTEEKVLVGISENQIAFQVKQTTFLSRLIEGNFPNYEQVIPSRKDIQITISTPDLLGITRRASLCSMDRGGSVKYGLKKGILHVSASSQSLEFEDEVEISYKGEDFQVAFNPLFILDALKNIEADAVTLGFTTPINPAVLEPKGDPDYRYVVMPMRE